MTRYRERREAGDFTPPDGPADELEAMTLPELKEAAAARGLPVSGSKGELIERLREG